MAGNGTTVRLLEPEDSRDPGLVDRLTGLINGVYATAESGLWREGATRTTASDLAALIGARQIAVATVDGEVAGSVHVHDVADDASEFGMLVADPDYRGTGVGRALVDFAEQRSRERGLRAMRLELLVPRTWRHPCKEFLRAWYRRLGYRVIRTIEVGETHPHLAPLLATPCDLEVYEKPLQPNRRGGYRASRSSTSAATRRAMSSRVARTSSSGRSLGSGRSQST
jgi:GNAT superfamily N-acetyltransferase